MQVNPQDVATLADFIRALNDAKPWLVVLLIVIALVVIGLVAFRMWLTHRTTCQLREDKNDRAVRYATAIEGLTATLKQQSSDLHELATEVRVGKDATKQLKTELTGAVSRSIDNMSVVLERHSGEMTGLVERSNELMAMVSGQLGKQMSFEDSCRIIGAYFSRLELEIIRDIHVSIRENDYENRKTFIANNVRTTISGHIDKIRTALHECNLFFDPDVFFRVYVKVAESDDPTVCDLDGVERYVIPDSVWRRVEQLYREKALSLADRLQEATLLIQNVLRDEYTRILRVIRARYDSGRRPDVTTAAHAPMHNIGQREALVPNDQHAKPPAKAHGRTKSDFY